MTVTHLVTHSGGFHADELLSSVILTRLFPEAEMKRSRDNDWITPSEGRIIYDVGRDYDATRQIFDHHQRPSPLREDGQPFSSFGLIWKHYGHDYLRALLVPEQDVENIHRSFVVGRPVQGAVAGRRRLGHAAQLCRWIRDLNPSRLRATRPSKIPSGLCFRNLLRFHATVGSGSGSGEHARSS